MPGIRFWFQRAVKAIVNMRQGANKAATGFCRASRASFCARGSPRLEFVTPAHPFSRIRVSHSRPAGAIAAENQGSQMNKIKVKAAALPAGLPIKFLAAAAAALAFALLAIPRVGHAQGIVRGAQEGAYEGNRVAGPVGGVVGGAVGAGVGGAMGAIHGVFGIPYGHHYRCRGYYRHGYFHCYR
jgi:hypothetical protein